jgi:hypothetical protein
MAAIHGQSAKALRYFRKHTASLAVYWVYVARANYENVAWPSLTKLAAEAGWSYNNVRDARAWLVEVEALEAVQHYVRPEWRALPKADKAKRVNLDKSEYYRPTGHLRIKGQLLPLLYFGGHEAADIDHQPADESTVDPSMSPIDQSGDNARGDHELISSISTRPHFNVLNTTRLKYKDGKPVDPIGFGLEVNAVFYGYLDALVAVEREQVAAYEHLWREHGQDAKALALARIKPKQLQDFIQAKYTDTQDSFWRDIDTPLPLKQVVKQIAGWLKRQQNAQERAQKVFVASDAQPPAPALSEAEFEALKAQGRAALRAEVKP